MLKLVYNFIKNEIISDFYTTFVPENQNFNI